jgi:putative modified peptide
VIDPVANDGDEETTMSQGNVERVIGRLATDEAFRRRFTESPAAAIHELLAGGMELTCTEVMALSGIDAALVERIANAIDPRLQKIAPCRGCP